VTGDACRRWAWLGGETVSVSEATVPLLDRGLQYGDGVFETLRAEGGGVFFMEEHLARLRAGLGVLRIDSTGICDLAREGTRAVLDRLGDSAATVKVIVTRGLGLGGPVIGRDAHPRVIVTGREDATDRPERMRAVSSSVARNERSPLAGVKSLNYLEMVLARAEASDAGADEAMVLNTSGRVAEASSANVFTLINGRLVTPSLDEGCLPGIVRAEVLRIARASGQGCVEGELEPDDLVRAEEAFLTNSRIGVAALVEIDGRPVGDGGMGPLTNLLRSEYRAAELRSAGREPDIGPALRD